jgi:hypothetical protein
MDWSSEDMVKKVRRKNDEGRKRAGRGGESQVTGGGRGKGRRMK